MRETSTFKGILPKTSKNIFHRVRKLSSYKQKQDYITFSLTPLADDFSNKKNLVKLGFYIFTRLNMHYIAKSIGTPSNEYFSNFHEYTS